MMLTKVQSDHLHKGPHFQSDYSSDPLFQNRYDMDNLNNSSYEDTNATGIDAEDDDLVYMGQYEDKADDPQTCQTDESKENDGTWSSPTEDIDCLLINEEGHLQNPDNVNCDHVDSDQNVRDEFNCGDNMSSDRTNDMLEETNTITDISHMIEMLQQQTMENGLHTCNLCLATFPDSATLKAHKQTHKEPEKGLPYLCNQRRKTFTRNCNLKSQGPHLCGHCGKAFPSLFKLQKHKCEHMGDKPYSCAVCGNKFSRLWNLKLHQRIHTQEKPHHCSMCDKSFTRADILKVHERTHTGERPYCCLVCGLSFKRLDHLKSHQRKHVPDHSVHTNPSLNLNSHLDGPRPIFRCGQCGKCFPHPSNLKSHLLTHTGERPFCCALCGRTFTKLSNLKAHRRVHTGERPYSCASCGKRFTQNCNLKRHQRIHLDGKEFSHTGGAQSRAVAPGRLLGEVFRACPTGRKPGKTQDVLEGNASISSRKEVCVEREVWASLLRLLPRQHKVEGGMDGVTLTSNYRSNFLDYNFILLL
uniref:C2H2-type domain-containing protein n=1 Tax=Periophthalmus magnuspinnatus TaxID=409849 RepID=A0A3B3ZUI1_9GOBI